MRNSFGSGTSTPSPQSETKPAASVPTTSTVEKRRWIPRSEYIANLKANGEYNPEKLKAEKEARISTIHTKLESITKRLTELSPEEVRSMISVTARFHNYSFNNACLIAFQIPNASITGSLSKWKELGYKVKPEFKKSGATIVIRSSYESKSVNITQDAAASLSLKEIGGGFYKPESRETFKAFLETNRLPICFCDLPIRKKADKPGFYMQFIVSKSMNSKLHGEISKALDNNTEKSEKKIILSELGLGNSISKAEIRSDGSFEFSLNRSGGYAYEENVVFDISQMEPITDADGNSLARPIRQMTLSSEISREALEEIFSNRYGITCKYLPLQASVGGYVERGNQNTIFLNSNLSHSENVGTMIHEFSHLKLGHTEEEPHGIEGVDFSENSSFDDRIRKEVQAELLTALLSEPFGVNRISDAYIRSFMLAGKKDPDFLREQFPKICYTFKAVMDHIRDDIGNIANSAT